MSDYRNYLKKLLRDSTAPSLKVIGARKDTTVQQANIQTPPLGNTPMPKINNQMAQNIDPQTGLTRTESALLSPTEQIIARRT